MMNLIKTLIKIIGLSVLTILTFIVGIGAILYVVVDLLLNTFPW